MIFSNFYRMIKKNARIHGVRIISSILVIGVLVFSVPFQINRVDAQSTPGSPGQNAPGSRELAPGIIKNPDGTFRYVQPPSYGVQNGGVASTSQSSSVAGSCIGGILGQAVSRAITGAIGSIAESAVKVGITSTESQAQAGISFFGVPVGISWDSVGYCFINAIIAYIADSTIAWINGGFNGNPAFLRNPTAFFKNLADREAGAFIGSLVNGTLGVNACQPIKIEVAIGLANQYGGGGSKGSGTQCTLSQIMKTQQGFQAFVKGAPAAANWSNFYSVSQNLQNNKQGLYILSVDSIDLSVKQKQNTIQVGIGQNNGFLSYEKCGDWKEDKDASGKVIGESKDCEVVTPGKTIADAASKITGIGLDRTILATKFDQVISALVNQLVKTALSKAFSK